MGFRRQVAQTFGIRTLRDFFNASGQWPTAQEFAWSHVDYSQHEPTVYTQFQWLKSLHGEGSQVLARVMPICGLLTAHRPTVLQRGKSKL
ncbi:TPA: hypothetical protein N0F65_011272 [Lagenidium giganteum]|uniref:Uncharacterized protein n=1 Tax=Lagenidium giganteum TaxID=4803 RepID=A0AAV2YWJ0_9STRA|nr:TPA: hypothetical protein N0F65_011272 [Lagenidium giganteum]